VSLDAAARLSPQQISFAPPQRVAADVTADLVQLLAIANHAVEKTALPQPFAYASLTFAA
jgi:hypothetical protein